MRIYKFKGLTNEQTHPHFLQIVLNNSIWCASPDSLNDKDEEFRFKLDYSPSPNTHQLLSQVVSQYRTTNFRPPDLSVSLALQNDRLRAIAQNIFDSTIEECRAAAGITSFSAKKVDEQLWKEYGGEGNGVCIEINVPDHMLGDIYHPVHYVVEKTFHIDTILESALFTNKRFQTYRNMLLTKTKKWEYEQDSIHRQKEQRELDI